MTDIVNDVFERRIQVPWIFFAEWQNVHADVYSNDVEQQRRGYERMLLWKARQSQLPAGVECTLELIHVHIIDQEVTQQIANGMRPIYAQHEMQLMCSAAVMRYLNHVSNVMKTGTDTMYAIAKQLKIPSWLVLLRHDSAHRTSLPSLEVLRMAINFALEWLNENYWKNIAVAPELVVSNTEHFSDKRMEEYLDVWQSLKMYQINNYKTTDNISDEKLRNFIGQLLYEKTNYTDTQESDVWKNSSHHLKDIIARMRGKLFKVIDADHSKLEKLLGLILESESFIPPVQYLSDGNNKELSHETILHWLCRFWMDFLIPLQENFGLFPSLVHKLILLLKEENCKHRQLIMALWIKQLCISMSKSRAIMTKVSSRNIVQLNMGSQKKSVETLKPKMKVCSEVIENFNKENAHLKHGFLALCYDPNGNSCPVADVKIAVLSPNEFTLVFLSSLLDVASPVIPDTSKHNLVELLSIRLGTTDLSTVKSNKVIHTVEDLYTIGGKGMSKIKFCGENEEPLDYASEYDWATCPLGILPWQKDSEVNLDMPSHISWALFVNEDGSSSMPKNTFVCVPHNRNKVNWHAVTKNMSLVRTRMKKSKKVKTRRRKKAALLQRQETVSISIHH